MTAARDELPFAAGADYRRGSSRKPPRPHARRRRCVSEINVTRRSGTFQKLDREMGKFVKNQHIGAPVVSEGESCSVRGVRHGVKWKCGWMFEQDSLYWETVRRQEEEEEDQSWRCLQVVDQPRGDELSDSSAERRHRCSSTDHESVVSSGVEELHLRRSHARRSRAPMGENHGDHEGKFGEKKPHGWPAVLKAKCEVLQMEKELADQRLRQQCADMAQAAEMAHCLRTSVQTILETAKRGTVSAPCTPGRRGHGQEDVGLQQRIQRLHTVTSQRDLDLEDQAKSFRHRIDTLRLQSQIRSGDSNSSSRNEYCNNSNKTRLSSTSSTTQLQSSDGEDWVQVQEVLKQLRGKTGSLQYSCENWEKRAIFAESKAASLQIEEERWRVEAQKSEEKVRELERELVQVRATLEEVRNRHALEQSRLLGSGSNHGYTLVLQPILTSDSCGGHCHSSSPPVTTLLPPDEDDEVVGEIQNEVLNSPEREPSTESGQASSRHRYEGALDDEDECPTPPPPTKTEQSSSIIPETAKTDIEKSLSQKWFKQRPKSRRPVAGAPSGENSMSEARSTLGNSPIPGKRGAGKGRNQQKPGPVYAGSTRVSPPSLLEKRVPLREIKRNSAPSENTTKSECS